MQTQATGEIETWYCCSNHSVLVDTIFHVQSKTRVHSAELASSLFQQRCTIWITMVWSIVVSSSELGAPTTPKYGPTQYLRYHNCK